MFDCIPLSREMLKDPIDIGVADESLDFSQARALAEARARREAADPMLLAWYDRAAAAFSPQAPCCTDDKPGWLVYAESRGGDLVIDINHEAYVFVYRRTLA
jgi:Domain of unknown function (DUF5619)